MKKLFLAAMVSALCALAAEFSGKWAGTLEATRQDGSAHTDSVHFNLKQDGATVTGTGGGPHDSFPINNGKVDGNTLTFELAPEGRGSFKITVTVDGDKMTGDVTRERDGRTQTAKLLLKRESN